MSSLRLLTNCLLLSFLAATTLAADQRVAGLTGEGASAGHGEIVAKAGTFALDGADIRSVIAALPANERVAATSSLASLEQVVRAELVRRAVLSQAQSKDFVQQADTLAALDRVRSEALVRLWIASQAKVPAGYPSDADIKAAYDANQAALAGPTQYHLAQIFVSAPDGADPTKLSTALRKINDIEAKLAAKSDFGQIAQSQSEHAESAAHGGDLGYVADNRMAPEILAAVRTQKVGDIIGPVKTSQGLHFFKLLDRKPGALPALAQVHDALANALKTRKASQLERAYLTTLSDKLGVTVNQIELAKLQPTLTASRQ
jgi:parvulin-like peptidyl-prolyl isomerase